MAYTYVSTVRVGHHAKIVVVNNPSIIVDKIYNSFLMNILYKEELTVM
jgi:hypothetical protein